MVWLFNILSSYFLCASASPRLSNEQVHNTILMEQVSEGVEEGKGERGEEWNGRKKLPKS
jgi:hypothetical protein